jgi:hypothetical protein
MRIKETWYDAGLDETWEKFKDGTWIKYVGWLAIVGVAYWFVYIYLLGVLTGGDPNSWLP